MDSARSSAVLNSRFTGPGSPWEKAKERAALHQKSALRSAAEYGNLPSDYCALKGDYTRVTNATGNPYIDSGPGIQDPAKIPPVNYPNVHPPNEKAVSDYLLNRGAVPQYVRPQIEEKPTSPNIKNYPCVEEGAKQYDFLSQTPGITRDNLAIPKPELKETNYLQSPRAKDFQPPANQKFYKPEGRIGVEHSLNKSFQNPKPSERYTSPEMGISKFSGGPQTPSPSQDYPKNNYPRQESANGDYQKYMTQSPTMTDYPPEGRYTQFKEPEIPQYKEPEIPQYKHMPDMQYQAPEMSQKIPEMQKPQPTTQNINLSELHKVEPTFESQALKGLKRIRTTNQTYGSWIGDPFLEGKDWYRSPRFPHVKSYLTKHKEESGSWM